jgi:lysophospholipase L1-like esterase
MRRLVVSHVGADYDNGGEQTAAYARLVDLNASYGAATVFVAIPVPDAMLTEFFHGGRAAYAEVCEQVRTFVATLGVPFLDVSDGFEDTLFYADPMHLNGVGRERFSERVAQALVEHLPAPDGRVSAT